MPVTCRGVTNVTGTSVIGVTEVHPRVAHDAPVDEREEVNQMATKKVTPKARQSKTGTSRKPAATRVTKATKSVKAIKNVKNTMNLQ
jgi:hypothetical protein